MNRLAGSAAAQRFTHRRVAFPVRRADTTYVGFDLRLYFAVFKFIVLLVKIEKPRNISGATLPAGVP